MAISISEFGTSDTLDFRDGSFVVSEESIEPQQIRSEAEDLTVRVTNVSSNRRRMLHVTIKELQQGPETDGATTYRGADALRTFIEGTLDFASTTMWLDDADGDTYIVRYWGPSQLNLNETRQGVFEGELIFRIEV